MAVPKVRVRLPRVPARLTEISLRDLLVVGLPSLALLAAGFWAAALFIRPAPPDRLILTSGYPNSAYGAFAARYRDILARYRIQLVDKPSSGAGENLQRLRDPKFEVDAGFVQSGMGNAGDADDGSLVSLGSLFYEPLWVFYRDGLVRRGAPQLDRLAELRGRRIAIGSQGTGSYRLAMELLGANGIDATNTHLLETGGPKAIEALKAGEIDAIFTVGAPQSASVWVLLYTPGVRLMNMSQAEALTLRFPYLSRVTLPEGAIDFVRDIPSRDIALVAPTASLLVRKDTHPALMQLLLQAATEVHGGPGIFQRPGQFPNNLSVDFPLASEADRYYKSGKPFLQRYLPFWAATLADRLIVMAVPLLALLLPIIKFAPPLYSWRVRSRIYRRYGELKFIEAEVENDPGRHTREEWMQRIDAVEANVNRIPTPLAFADMLYTLRSHIGLVRETVLRRTSP